MNTFSFYHDTRRANKSGMYPIRLNITMGGQRISHTTDVKCSIDDWNAVNSGKCKDKRLLSIRNALESLRLQCERFILDAKTMGRQLSAADMSQMLLELRDPSAALHRQQAKVKANTIEGWFTRRMELKSGKTRDSIKQTLARITAFGEADTQISDITPSWLSRFDAFLAKSSPSANARAVHMRNLRAVINFAIDEGATDNYPFRRFRIKTEKTKKRSLSVEELRRLFAVSGLTDSDRKYLDIFKLMFLLVGINLVDLLKLKYSNMQSGRIEYKRSKTKKNYSIKVEPEAMKIIERYNGVYWLIDPLDNVGNWEQYRRRINKALRNIGDTVIGKYGKKVRTALFPQLTTYWARHSWATIARSIGVSVDDIALALGHGDGHDLSHIYIRDDFAKIDQANRKVIDWVFYGKLPGDAGDDNSNAPVAPSTSPSFRAVCE